MPVFHTAIATAEMHHIPSQCAYIQCLVSINSVNEHQCVKFFLQLFFHMHFHIRCQYVRLSLSCHLSHGNKTEYWWEGSTSTYIASRSTSSTVGQLNKICGKYFGPALVYIHSYLRGRYREAGATPFRDMQWKNKRQLTHVESWEILLWYKNIFHPVNSQTL